MINHRLHNIPLWCFLESMRNINSRFNRYNLFTWKFMSKIFKYKKNTYFEIYTLTPIYLFRKKQLIWIQKTSLIPMHIKHIQWKIEPYLAHWYVPKWPTGTEYVPIAKKVLIILYIHVMVSNYMCINHARIRCPNLGA